jgi:hypothetical protein
MKDTEAQALEAIIETLPKPAEPTFVTLDKAPSELLPGERADVSWISTEDVDRDQEIVVDPRRARGLDAELQLSLSTGSDAPPSISSVRA